MMTAKTRGLGMAVAFAFLSGCDSNPEGPRAPSHTPLQTSADGQTVPRKPERQPVTRNPREIVNPD
jgi:hypothetical protein